MRITSLSSVKKVLSGVFIAVALVLMSFSSLIPLNGSLNGIASAIPPPIPCDELHPENEGLTYVDAQGNVWQCRKFSDGSWHWYIYTETKPPCDEDHKGHVWGSMTYGFAICVENLDGTYEWVPYPEPMGYPLPLPKPNNMPRVSQNHTTVAANGYVYVLGGDDDIDNTPASSDVHFAKLNMDGSTGEWATNLHPMPAMLDGHSSVVANGYICYGWGQKCHRK